MQCAYCVQYIRVLSPPTGIAGRFANDLALTKKQKKRETILSAIALQCLSPCRIVNTDVASEWNHHQFGICRWLSNVRKRRKYTRIAYAISSAAKPALTAATYQAPGHTRREREK